MSTVKGMLTRVEAAARVGRSVRTIRAWQADGLRTMLGLIPEGDLLEWDRRMRERVGGRPTRYATSERWQEDYDALRTIIDERVLADRDLPPLDAEAALAHAILAAGFVRRKT